MAACISQMMDSASPWAPIWQGGRCDLLLPLRLADRRGERSPGRPGPHALPGLPEALRTQHRRSGMDQQEPEQRVIELGPLTVDTYGAFPGLCDVALGIPAPGLTDD